MNKKLKSKTTPKANQTLAKKKGEKVKKIVEKKLVKKKANKNIEKEVALQPQSKFTAKSNKAIEDKIIVKKSKIHGKGCFAKKKISKGAYLGSYEGITVLDDNTHVLWVQQDHGGWHLIDGKNELRFVNHSLTPNAEWDANKLYALRTIEEGEEITFHYGEDWEDHQ